MKNFGEIFKRFRESRGLTLQAISKSGISTSQLSRFENGETDLTITKFIHALDELNMPIEEFMYAAHDFQRDEINEILYRIQYYVTTRDLEGMKSLLISQLEKVDRREQFHNINVILIKIRLQDLSGKSYYTQKDISYLVDYLFSVDYWGNYELLIFGNTIDVLPHKTFMLMSREMCRRTDFYKELPTNRRLIATMLLNGFITCIENNHLIDALYFEKQLNQCHFLETEVYEKLVFQYAKNLYKYKKTRDKTAIIEMRKCIAALKLAGSYHLASIYEQHLEKLLEEK